MSKNTCFCAHLAHRMSKWTKSLKIDFDMHWTENKAFFSWKKMIRAIFGHFLALFGPRNLFLVPGIYFGTYDFGPVRTSVRPSVRAFGIYFLTARQIFLIFFKIWALGQAQTQSCPNKSPDTSHCIGQATDRVVCDSLYHYLFSYWMWVQ